MVCVENRSREWNCEVIRAAISDGIRDTIRDDISLVINDVISDINDAPPPP